MKNYLFEVCTNSVESCIAAQEGGANRVELCAGFPEGGTTPSYGEIAMAREVLTTTRLHVIIRPRGGDFLYSPVEVKTMLKDIEMARQLGADGVVFGCLTTNGGIDVPVMKQLMEASKGLSVTFHRAFDVCRDASEALEQIIDLGCDRILTSGQQATAELGIPLLKELRERVNEKNICRIAKETGIQEFHFSARESIKSGMEYKNEAVSMGGTVHISEYERNVTTVKRVKDTIESITSSL